VRAGGLPVLVDSDAATWNLDVGQVEAKITARTRAIMPVHIYGLPVDMDPLLEIARRHGLAIVEDAAEMHGQTYRGRPCGSFGELSIFSFYPNKHVTTGEGGMVLTDDDALAARVRGLRNLCFQPQRRFVHEELGWNLRMTNLQAALGVAQLERLDESLKIKRRMGERYTQLLKDTPKLQLPLAQTAYARSVYWVYGVVLDAGDAAAMMAKLAERGIGTRPFFWPMHEQPVFRRKGWFAGERYPVAERLARRGFYLPSGMALTDEEMVRAASALKECLQ
jgi:perosamine synthetase